MESGQSIASAARTLGIIEQTLRNWIHTHKTGKLTAVGRGSKLTSEQIEMRQHAIQARGKRKFRVTTTDSSHSMPVAPNLLNRNFTIAKPNTTWTGDVTYIATEEGSLYLGRVMDLFSRRIVGWSMKTTVDRSLVIDALEMACLGRRPGRGEAIFHSDRGSQYASEDFGEVMKLYGLIPSMSRKGNCWDNAVTKRCSDP